jgi:hypothetical protein
MAVKYGSWAHSTDYQFKSAMDRYLFTELAYWADSKGIVRITQAELSERMQTSPRTIATGFRNLTEANFLKRLGHGRYGLVFGGGETKRDSHALPPKPPVPPNESCVMCDEPIPVTSKEYAVRYSTAGLPNYICGKSCARNYDLG